MSASLAHGERLSDAAIRPALKRHLARAGACLIDELGLCRGQVRVDLAVVGRVLHGIEIKSDRDSLRRLVGQSTLYGRVFDRMTLVAGDRHLAEAQQLVPTWWGLLLAQPGRRGPRFTPVRPARRNVGVEPRALVELLWLEEAMSLLEARGAARGARGKPRRVVWDRVCEAFSTREIAAAVRDRLWSRAGEPLR